MSFAPAPLTVIFNLALSAIENALAMEISARELSDIFFSCGEIQIALTVLLIIICSSQIDVSIGIADPCFAD
jgi:ABC-type xylose transport system permease subunit